MRFDHQGMCQRPLLHPILSTPTARPNTPASLGPGCYDDRNQTFAAPNTRTRHRLSAAFASSPRTARATKQPLVGYAKQPLGGDWLYVTPQIAARARSRLCYAPVPLVPQSTSSLNPRVAAGHSSSSASATSPVPSAQPAQAARSASWASWERTRHPGTLPRQHEIYRKLAVAAKLAEEARNRRVSKEKPEIKRFKTEAELVAKRRLLAAGHAAQSRARIERKMQQKEREQSGGRALSLSRRPHSARL